MCLRFSVCAVKFDSLSNLVNVNVTSEKIMFKTDTLIMLPVNFHVLSLSLYSTKSDFGSMFHVTPTAFMTSGTRVLQFMKQFAGLFCIMK